MKSAAWGLAYIVVFGLGSIIGMVVLSFTIAVPLRFSARRLIGVRDGLCALIGLATVGLGLAIVYRIGFIEGALTAIASATV